MKIHRSGAIEMLLTSFCPEAKMKEKLLKREKFISSCCIACQCCQALRYGQTSSYHVGPTNISLMHTEQFLSESNVKHKLRTKHS